MDKLGSLTTSSLGRDFLMPRSNALAIYFIKQNVDSLKPLVYGFSIYSSLAV